MLIAQAKAEDMALLTADETVAQYPGNIIFVKK
jgi:PIN domain nuclease of toxin-antitoxin system